MRGRDDDAEPLDQTGAATMYPQHAGWRGDRSHGELPAWVTDPTEEYPEVPPPHVAAPVSPSPVERMEGNRGPWYRLGFGRKR